MILQDLFSMLMLLLIILKNNYKVEVEIPDQTTGVFSAPKDVERFHDAYRSQTVQVEAGVVDKKYADQLFLGLIASSNYKEVQTGYKMNFVAGEVYKTDKVLIPTIKYQKYDLFTKGLYASLYANYNIKQVKRVDTSNKVYDWNGDFCV